MTLAEFMAACLTEDQQEAEKLMRFAQETHLAFQDHKRFPGRDVPGWHTWPDVEAMCGRVLADIKAKGAVLKAHKGWHHSPGMGNPAWDECSECGGDGKGDWPCDTVLIVAQTFRGRHGWQAAWEVRE